jgi:hypothetical protein
MSFLDKLKQKAEELDLKNKAEHLKDEAAKAAHQAKEKAGDLAAENRDKVEQVLEKATAKIDERTEHKYTDKLAKAKEQVTKGVDRLAEGGSSATAAGGTPGAAASGSPGSSDTVHASGTPDAPGGGFDAAAADLPAPAADSLGEAAPLGEPAPLDEPTSPAADSTDSTIPDEPDDGPAPDAPKASGGW